MPHYEIKRGKEYMIISVAIVKAHDKILYSVILKSKKKNSNLAIEYVLNIIKDIYSRLTQILHLRVKF